ncbi:hypothetical protein MAM1_0150d06643 [Mucor ambiguus]|uniref:F-box domain-containing protein n=1 Tax=Mucor ambiguus TaxID=91626 RepID=A0A0C9LVP8_9FUNG|nr:hypothetical protein MAM1_0150d06643 [Mucor ambiguus]
MYLPTEIIKKVGTYLTLAEQGSCIRVCYAWYEPFLDLLYTRVHLHTRHQFRLFYRSIKSSATIQDSLGRHVKELVFDYSVKGCHVGLTRDELETFPDYFTQLEILDFDPDLWQYMRYSEKFAQMKCIRQFPMFTRKSILQSFITDQTTLNAQLTYLAISGQATEHLLNSSLFTTSLWGRMPKLETLVIRGTTHNNINVKMIMALGAQLSRLKHLTLACLTLPLQENDMSSTTTFPLFTSAQSLTLDDVHLKNWRMITFLSLAFYHVEELDFDMTFDWFYNENVTIELYEQSMDACMGFAQLCIFLKKIRFRRISTSVFPFPYDAFFQEIADIHQDNVKVEMTDYAWWSTIDPASSFKAVTAQTGLLSSANLKWSWTGKKSDVALFKNLKFCRHLTHLVLDCDVPLKNGFRLDLLLDNCPTLETFCVSHALVTTGRSIEKASDARYHIKSLKLKDAVLGDHLMDYIAKSCLHLDNLWITNCTQEKPRRSAFVVIRMPEHNFKSIRLNSLHLNPGGSAGKSEANIAILSFYESTRYANQTERWRRAEGKFKNVTAPEMWRFYHVHKTDVSKKEKSNKQLRRLSTEEAAMIANFEMTDRKWKAVKNASKRKTFSDRASWEKDIQFGAVLLLCKSVEKLEFNELKV